MCVAEGPLAKTCGEYLSKGQMVAVKGTIKVQKYLNKSGKRRSWVEIICREVQLLDFGKKEAQ
jgi:single-strand DNA-binding protein